MCPCDDACASFGGAGLDAQRAQRHVALQLRQPGFRNRERHVDRRDLIDDDQRRRVVARGPGCLRAPSARRCARQSATRSSRTAAAPWRSRPPRGRLRPSRRGPRQWLRLVSTCSRRGDAASVRDPVPLCHATWRWPPARCRAASWPAPASSAASSGRRSSVKSTWPFADVVAFLEVDRRQLAGDLRVHGRRSNTPRPRRSRGSRSASTSGRPAPR